MSEPEVEADAELRADREERDDEEGDETDGHDQARAARLGRPATGRRQDAHAVMGRLRGLP